MTVSVKGVLFGGEALPFIAGPCVIESRDHAIKMATQLQAVFSKHDVPFVFKSSFDKANRTSGDSFRGPGLDEGLAILSEVKRETGVPVLTDIHTPDQAKAVGEVVDILQVPAFLCRQTDLLSSAAQTGKCVNVKKGQFVAPSNAASIVKKIENGGGSQILLTERGATFGYNNLISDMRSIAIMQATGHPVIFDASHSAQRPSADGNRSGGDREMIPLLARAAVAAGCDGLFVEVHDDVVQARSDAATQWPLDQIENLLISLIRIREAVAV
ncbi:MAG: 3-deoxy-8-phosphooctulonate synthase [Candidatus Marinimicrobia bacterium]|nr:3-deoxy-8-phosphooctulonate synthase [Candidatus Neomarinimicrobiota bacterium]|tara:strand:- start:1003 stop:1815 length:813 start_codon:yes stop_codon:yes gene_type:complete